MTAPLLAHLAEALRSHRQTVGAGRVPAALQQIESELWAALPVDRQPRDVVGSIGHAERVLVTTVQAGEMLGLSERGVRQLRASGRLRAVVVGRSVCFLVSDLVRFAEDNRQETS